MTSRKRSRADDLRALCGAVGPDDGVDPRTYFTDKPDRRSEAAVRRLCGQVARTLRLVFPGGTDDDRLRALAVGPVTPAPDATRLLVTLVASGPIDAGAALAAVRPLEGWLRSEVAAALSRRHAPKLVFEVREGPR